MTVRCGPTPSACAGRLGILEPFTNSREINFGAPLTLGLGGGLIDRRPFYFKDACRTRFVQCQAPYKVTRNIKKR